MLLNTFPFFHQISDKDCGPTCLRMISKHYGRKLNTTELNSKNLSHDGLAISDLNNLASELSFNSMIVKTDFDSIKSKAPLPFIAHWNQNHYVVVHKITDTHVYVADPAFGKTKYTINNFFKGWLPKKSIENSPKGIAILLEPSEQFLHTEATHENTIEKKYNSAPSIA